MSAATAWTVIGASAVIAATIRAAGPVALGGRELPPWAASVIALLAPALLAALVCVSALADGRELGVGADTAGVAAGGILLWRGASVVAGVAVAAVVTAALRAL